MVRCEIHRERAGLLSWGHDNRGGRSRRKTQIVPLLIRRNDRAFSTAAYLQTQGFAVRARRPLTVMHGTARLRFSLTSGTSDDELVRLESFLNSCYEQGSWSAAVARA